MSQPARHLEPLVDPFVDGELPPEKMVEVEQQMLSSADLLEQVRLTQALKLSMRRVVEVEQPSAAFEERLKRALQAERQREEALEERSNGRALPWKYILPLAAAAGFTLVLGAGNEQPEPPQAHASSTKSDLGVMAASTQPTALSVDELVDELVSHHAAPSAPEVMEPQLVQDFERRVGVPVHLPQGLTDYGAQWLGGSVVMVRNQNAASFHYRMGAHRVTVYVYDSERVPVRYILKPRVLRNTPVYMGSRRGYTIAAVERRGVGYAVATDLDEPESAELVVASMH
ncbi:MAG: hypothetical protein KIT72_05055 [Polyangiaceae bacterium]|nr:hypothetical protein [Polyangiaceae bacterium]MCW5789772.1 hypothetical protein [Polyangiaceae bacterium]